MKKKVKISRSENMSRIKGKDTNIEIILRKALWARGIRFRKNCIDIIGKPDICIKKYKLAIFCDNEFWHGKLLKDGKNIPKTNTEFWINKLNRNIERDKEVNKILNERGWMVLRFLGNDIQKNTDMCVNKIIKYIKSQN